MRELALHILDIAENGLAAGASLITIEIQEDRERNLLTIRIADNGRGIPEGRLQEALDPFYTTRTTRRVGLGLSLFREASRRCGGEFKLRSREGHGTEVIATFQIDHIDLPPLGDIAGSLTALMMGNPDVDWVYRHSVGGETFEMDTRQVRAELEGVPLNHPEVINYLGAAIRKSLEQIKAGRFAAPLAGEPK